MFVFIMNHPHLLVELLDMFLQHEFFKLVAMNFFEIICHTPDSQTTYSKEINEKEEKKVFCHGRKGEV